MAIYEFTPEDLKSNRNGFISPGQREMLKGVVEGTHHYSRVNARIAVGFLIFGLGFILVLYMQNEDSRAAFFASPYNILYLASAIPLTLAILGAGMYVTRRMADRLMEAELQSAEGAVSFDQDHSSRSGITSYHVDFDKVRFSFTEEMDQVFKEGERYRVYYLKSGPYQFIFSYEKT